jgi:hypothetical protein
MPIVFSQALLEYGATAALADGLSQLSLRLTNAVGAWRVEEAIVVLLAAAFLWKVLAAAR